MNREKVPHWEWNCASCSPLTEKGENIDVLIRSVGTNGARTRSFCLDRAVLWPIELHAYNPKKIKDLAENRKIYSRSIISYVFESKRNSRECLPFWNVCLFRPIKKIESKENVISAQYKYFKVNFRYF